MWNDDMKKKKRITEGILQCRQKNNIYRVLFYVAIFFFFRPATGTIEPLANWWLEIPSVQLYIRKWSSVLDGTGSKRLQKRKSKQLKRHYFGGLTPEWTHTLHGSERAAAVWDIAWWRQQYNRASGWGQRRATAALQLCTVNCSRRLFSHRLRDG